MAVNEPLHIYREQDTRMSWFSNGTAGAIPKARIIRGAVQLAREAKRLGDAEENRAPTLDYARETRALHFSTPTRCDYVWTLTVRNIGVSKVPGFYTWVDNLLPQLDVRDRRNSKLIVVPRKDLGKGIKREQEERKKAHKPSFPIAVQFSKPISPGDYENVKFAYASAYKPTPKPKKRKRDEKKKPIIELKHRFLSLIGYLEFWLPFETKAASSYLTVSAPEGYMLNVLEPGPGPSIYSDESSYVTSPIKSLRFDIQVPDRVAYWLVLGFIQAMVGGPLAFLLYLANQAQITVSLAMIGMSFTLLIAMRALLFENVGLLNRLNLWYIVAFVTNLAALVLIAVFAIPFVSQPADPNRVPHSIISWQPLINSQTSVNGGKEYGA